MNNWILLACALFVFFATMWPTLSEAFIGDRITYGPPFFNQWMIPLGLVLLFLAGAAPLLAYRRTTRDKLVNQFRFPLGTMAITIAVLAIAVPRTRVLTSVFHDDLQLPISLVNFGLVAFTFASVGQEFWRGMRVRAKQTGGSQLTSLIGLVFAKRRKYGGYVVHVAVAIMFFGFAGKAFEGMKDFTLQKPGQSFEYRGYEFRFDGLWAPSSQSDDNKEVAEAQVTLLKDGEEIAILHPARFRYAKEPDQPTTEVDIVSYLEEDVYIVLTGFSQNQDRSPKEVNFRIYINPLINWVWLGFFFLFLGTMICLAPQRWVDRMTPGRKSRIGRLGEAAVLLLVAGGIVVGSARMAMAQPDPRRQLEHDDPIQSAGPSHNQAAAHLARPDDPAYLAPYRTRLIAQLKKENPSIGKEELAQKVAIGLAPVVDITREAMAKLVCMCGGCTRETLYECKCSVAAVERQKVQGILARHDLLDPVARKTAYDEVVAWYTSRFGGEHALIIPEKETSGRVGWMVPYVMVFGGLALLYAAGRRWVRRGKREMSDKSGAVAAAEAPENEDYADRLDDELRDTD